MNNSEKGKYIAMGMAISATVMGTVVPVIAKSTQENITAIYKNIKVVADGKTVNVGKDEPFIYNGTTYLPVRVVGEAVGKNVSWDGNTNTVYLGQAPGEKAYLTDTNPPYDGEYYATYKGSKQEYFVMSGQKRTNGFTLREGTSYALINLNGQYRQMKFAFGHIDETFITSKPMSLRIYLDGNLSEEIDISGNDIAKQINVPVDSALQVKFELVYTDEPKLNQGSSLKFGFADIVAY